MTARDLEQPTRRDLLRILAAGNLAATLAPLLAFGRGAAAAGPPPSVLFIIVDDLRPELGCYGHQVVRSPSLDLLASQGFLFRRCYCQQALCAPSRSSFLSGRRPPVAWRNNNVTSLKETFPDVATLPGYFRRQGYLTAAVGKIHHHDRMHTEDWTVPHWRPSDTWPGYVNAENVRPAGGPQDDREAECPDSGNQPVLGPPTEIGRGGGRRYADERITDRAIEVLRRVHRLPFLLAVGFSKPHLPFACPKEYWDLYPLERISVPGSRATAGAAPLSLHDSPELRRYAGVPPEGDIPDGLARDLVRGYYACVSFVDAQIGRLLAELDRLQVREQTIVVVIGDQGFHLGENGLWGKQSNFEKALRVPLLMAGSRIGRPGRSTDALVELVDLYPSLCELTGLAPPAGLEGTSFLPLLEDPERPWKDAAFGQLIRLGTFVGSTIRTERYRFTRWTREGQPQFRPELYDHITDPGETTNVAGSPGYREVVAEMVSRLDRGWRGAVPSVP